MDTGARLEAVQALLKGFMLQPILLTFLQTGEGGKKVSSSAVRLPLPG